MIPALVQGNPPKLMGKELLTYDNTYIGSNQAVPVAAQILESPLPLTPKLCVIDIKNI